MTTRTVRAQDEQVRVIAMFGFLFRRRLSPSAFKVCGGPKKAGLLVVRPYRPDDFAACILIYKENEPGRFPPDQSDAYARYLARAETLVLVAELHGEVVGTAGIYSSASGSIFYYYLTYGLVAAKHQRSGIGTVLLLARVSLLPEPASSWPLFMQCVDASRSFYERFGFQRVRDGIARPPLIAGTFLAMARQSALRRSRAYLLKRGVSVVVDNRHVPFRVPDDKE